MYRILIIDDEPLIREGLKSVIDWEAYGFQIIGVGKDGRDGLDQIRTLRPDVVFADIRMPGLTGIELIRQAKEEGFACKFVILSGYSNFSYAQASIQLGIASYLLKPVDEDELIPLLKDIHKELKEERMISSQLMEFEKISVEQAWKNLIAGDVDELSLAMLEEPDSHYHLIKLIASHYKDLGSLRQELLDNVKNIARLLIDDATYYLLFKDQSEAIVKDTLAEISKAFKNEGNFFIQYAITKPVERLVRVPHAASELKKLEGIAYCYSEKQILSSDLFEQMEDVELDKKEFVTDISRALEFKATEQIDGLLTKLEEFYKGKCYDEDRVKMDLVDVTWDIYARLKRHYPELSIPTKESIIEVIFAGRSLKSTLSKIKENLFTHTTVINGFQVTPENMMEKVIAYVKQYYFEDLNLKVLAHLFNYNRSYLGKKFKKYTGVYFHTYLDQVRIEKAKILLAEKNLKVYEVSNEIGYCNMDYFYKKFKHYTGYSPKEYQKLEQAKNQ